MGELVARSRHRLERADAKWLLGLPAYLFAGVARHEGSHAIIARLEGAEIDRFVIWPQRDLGWFSWGYVTWSGETTSLSIAAPYLVAALVFVATAWVCRRAELAHWLWVNLVMVGMVSPLVDTAYNLGRGLAAPSGSVPRDVAQLRAELPEGVLIAVFVIAVVVGVAVLARTIGGRRPPTCSPSSARSAKRGSTDLAPERPRPSPTESGT